MKLLHILNELNPSGAETMLACAAPYFQRQGIELEILSTGPKPGAFAESLSQAGYQIRHLPFRRHPSFFLALYQLLKAGQYGSVHIHTEQASFWVTLVAILAGIPAKRCVRTIHSNFAFSGLLRWRRAWQRQLLAQWGAPQIAISPSVQHTELSCYRIHTPIIQNWYNSDRFTKTTATEYQLIRQQLNLLDSDFVVVSVGNCAQVKNHGALIEAIAGLNQQNMVYLHVGIEKDVSERILAENLGIADTIRFLGQQNDVRPYLRAADLYVMPSLYEGASIAAIEAIATETPVLFSAVRGLNDFAQVFQGLYFCEPTAESIQAALRMLIDTPKNELRHAVAGNAVRAENNFGIQRGVSAYISYYQGK